MEALIQAAKRYLKAVESYNDNRPDDEQFTWKEVREFNRNEGHEFEQARINLLEQIRLCEDDGR